MNSRVLGISLLFFGICLFAGLALFNYTVIVEAFGDGPPYYNRTTNMDKWTNPLPMLAIVDIVFALVCVLVNRFSWKNWKG